MISSQHGKLTNDGQTTYKGAKVVAIRDTSDGSKLYVAATGRPYPVAIVAGGKGKSGAVTFGDWNKSVSLSAPSNAVAIDAVRRLAGQFAGLGRDHARHADGLRGARLGLDVLDQRLQLVPDERLLLEQRGGDAVERRPVLAQQPHAPPRTRRPSDCACSSSRNRFVVSESA